MCVKLANLPSKNTHHKQIDRPDRWCVNDNIVAGTVDQDKNRYAGCPQDQLLSGNTVSHSLVRVSHAAVAGVWSTNSYLKYEFVLADGISKLQRKPTKCCPYEKGGTVIGRQAHKMAISMIPT